MSEDPSGLDEIDRLLLAELQRDADRSLVEFGDLVGLSPSAVSRRINGYKQSGVVSCVTALIDPAAAGVSLQIVCQIQCTDDSTSGLGRLKAELVDIPEVVQCYEIAGAIDLMVVFAVSAMSQYKALADDVLGDNPAVLRFESHIVMDALRPTACLPMR